MSPLCLRSTVPSPHKSHVRYRGAPWCRIEETSQPHSSGPRIWTQTCVSPSGFLQRSQNKSISIWVKAGGHWRTNPSSSSLSQTGWKDVPWGTLCRAQSQSLPEVSRSSATTLSIDLIPGQGLVQFVGLEGLVNSQVLLWTIMEMTVVLWSPRATSSPWSTMMPPQCHLKEGDGGEAHPGSSIFRPMGLSALGSRGGNWDTHLIWGDLFCISFQDSWSRLLEQIFLFSFLLCFNTIVYVTAWKELFEICCTLILNCLASTCICIWCLRLSHK